MNSFQIILYLEDLENYLFILLKKRKIKWKSELRAILKKLKRRFLSCDIFILLFEISYASGPVHRNLASPDKLQNTKISF